MPPSFRTGRYPSWPLPSSPTSSRLAFREFSSGKSKPHYFELEMLGKLLTKNGIQQNFFSYLMKISQEIQSY
jgi:hypothetical protein